MFRKILVAHDGSEGACKAFVAALELAARNAADLHMISVIEVHSHFASTVGEVAEGHSRVFGRIGGGTSQNLTGLSPCTVVVK